MSSLKTVIAKSGASGLEISPETDVNGNLLRPTIEFNAPAEVAELVYEHLDEGPKNPTNLAVLHVNRDGVYKNEKGYSYPRLWKSVQASDPDPGDVFAVYVPLGGEFRFPVSTVKSVSYAELVEAQQKDAQAYRKSRVLITPHAGAADISVDDLSQQVADLFKDKVIPALRDLRENEAYGLPVNAWPLSFSERNPYFTSGIALSGTASRRRTRDGDRAKKTKRTTKRSGKSGKKAAAKRTGKNSGKSTGRKSIGRKRGGAIHGPMPQQYGGFRWY